MKGGLIQDQHFTTSPKMTRVSKRLADCITWSHETLEGAQWTWEKVTFFVDSEAAQNVMPKSMFPEISSEESERSQNGKGFDGPGGDHIRITDSKSCPSELLRDLYARARGRSQT